MKESILQIIKQVLILAAVAAMFAVVRKWDAIGLFGTVPFIAAAFQHELFATLELHFWQFLFGIVGITVLSRGNLWSCGINSMNAGRSLAYLAGFYGAAAIILLILGAASAYVSIRFDVFPVPDRILVMVIHWLSSPVADQILFFGLFQTALLKFWTETFRVGTEEIPSVLFLTALIFALGRLGLPHYGSSVVEYAAGYGIGLFSGYVYYKTRSLLAPMLAQAFFFGMPDAVQLIFSTLGYRL